MNKKPQVTLEDIYQFIEQETGVKNESLTPDTELNNGLDVDGDDFEELIHSFAQTFHVNIDHYLWYFHHVEEGWSVGSLFFKTPNDQVEHIPVTLNDLLNAARLQKWPIVYPVHTVSHSRPDLLIDKIIALLAIIALLSILLFG